MAFAQMEPFGGAIEDLRAGVGPALTMNMRREKGADPITALAFFPWHEPAAKREPEPGSPEVLAARIRREIFGVKD